jgi:hypothetical protein
MRNLDFLSYEPTLLINSDKRFKTNLGAIIQFIYALLQISAIAYFSQDIYYRQNPTVIESSKSMLNPPLKNLTPNDFNVMFAINHPIYYNPYRNESIYTVEFYKTKLENSLLVSSEKIESEACSIEHFKGVDPSIMPSNFEYSDYYCFSKDVVLQLAGLPSNNETYYFKFFVKQCDPKTSKVPCATEDEMSYYLDGTLITLNHIDKQFDPSDYDNPVKSFFKEYSTRISRKLYTSMEFDFKTVTFNDDIGVLFEQVNTHNYISIEQILVSIDFQPYEYFLEVDFLYGQANTIVTRKYKRLQQVIAEIGGLLNALFITSAILVKFITESMYYSHLVESVFERNATVEILNSNQNIIQSESKFVIHSKPVGIKNKPASSNIVKGGGIDEVGYINLVGSIKSNLDIKMLFKKFKELELIKFILFNSVEFGHFGDIIRSKKSANILLSGFNPGSLLSSENEINYQRLDGAYLKKLTNIKKNFNI